MTVFYYEVLFFLYWRCKTKHRVMYFSSFFDLFAKLIYIYMTSLPPRPHHTCFISPHYHHCLFNFSSNIHHGIPTYPTTPTTPTTLTSTLPAQPFPHLSPRLPIHLHLLFPNLSSHNRAPTNNHDHHLVPKNLYTHPALSRLIPSHFRSRIPTFPSPPTDQNWPSKSLCAAYLMRAIPE